MLLEDVRGGLDLLLVDVLNVVLLDLACALPMMPLLLLLLLELELEDEVTENT